MGPIEWHPGDYISWVYPGHSQHHFRPNTYVSKPLQRDLDPTQRHAYHTCIKYEHNKAIQFTNNVAWYQYIFICISKSFITLPVSTTKSPRLLLTSPGSIVQASMLKIYPQYLTIKLETYWKWMATHNCILSGPLSGALSGPISGPISCPPYRPLYPLSAHTLLNCEFY